MEREMLLEKYLQNKLTESERVAFEAFLERDPDFKKEVEFQTDIKRAVTAEEDSNFMAILFEFEAGARRGKEEAVPMDTKNKKILPTKWLVAASIALLLGVAYFFMADRTTDSQELFAQNFEPYRNVTHPITRGEEAMDMKDEAFIAYGKGEYEAAVILFTKLYTSANKPYYLFYNANALIELNRADEAIPLLKRHLGSNDSLRDKSYWYLAMAYLQLDDVENAKLALQKTVEAKNYKDKEAKQLLDGL